MAKRRKNQQNKANAQQQQQQQQQNAANPDNDAAAEQTVTQNNDNAPIEEVKNLHQVNDQDQQPCAECGNFHPAEGLIDDEVNPSMMVQPTFNISAAVTTQQQAQAYQNTAQASQQCNKPAQQAMTAAKYHKSQYPQGASKVVTMHDVIDQQEKQKAQQQNQHSQQAHPGPGTSAGTGQPQPVAAETCEADEEEGSEESEEDDDEDTEEEALYGPEQEDDISSEIEEEHHSWVQQTAMNTNAQYRQPGAAAYQGQPGQAQGYQQHPQQQHAQPQTQQQQHYGQNTASQNAPTQEQHAYSQQQQTQPQQQPRSQQTDTAVDSRLHQCLTDMLINLYNGKGTEEYRENYSNVVTILEDQARRAVLTNDASNGKQTDESKQNNCEKRDVDIGILMKEKRGEEPGALPRHSPGSYISISQLQNLFESKIESIVGTVRDKLQEDAKKDNLVIEEVDEVPLDITADQTNQTVQDQYQRSATAPKTLKVKEYRGDLTRSFDEILSAVGDYFDLFKNNTDKLEALWLQLLDYLNVKNSNQYRIFRSMHYSIYVNTVIKNKTITAIINEAKRWNGTPNASKHLKEHLEKIQQIESEKTPIPETYESFQRRKALDFDLNEYTRTDYAQKMQQEQQQRNQQQMRQAQGGQQDNAKNGGTAASAVCQNDYRDCRHFQDHQRQHQGGKCMCRCVSKPCGCHYQGFGHKNGQRGNQQKRGADKRQGKKGDETMQGDSNETVDKQFTQMNIDDLMDYILQPQPAGQKNKKKQKKRKGVTDEPEEDSVKANKTAGTAPPLNNSQPSSVNGSGGKSQPSQQQPGQAQSSNLRKQDDTSSDQHSDKESYSIQTRSTSRSKFSSEKLSQQTSGKDGQQNSRSHQGDTTRPKSVTCSSDYASSCCEPGVQLKSDQEFEEEIQAFARTLDRVSEQKITSAKSKLRPNYEEPWILKLKMRLETLESKKQHPSASTPNAASSTGKTAPSASGPRSKH